jgi:hypothetical protein
VIKFVSDLQQVGGFHPGTLVPPPIKLTHHDITKILLKVALNTINLYLNLIIDIKWNDLFIFDRQRKMSMIKVLIYVCLILLHPKIQELRIILVCLL